MEEDPDDTKVKKNPRQKANPLSALTFWWFLPLFWKGYKDEYRPEDLFEVLSQHESEELGNQLETAWENEIRRKKGNPSICWTLARVFGSRIIFYGIFFGILELFVKMIQPVAIGYLVTSFSQHNGTSKEYIYSSVIIGSSILSVLIYFPTLMGLCHIALKMKVALASLIYRKSLRLSLKSLEDSGGVGHVTNLISNDLSRLDLTIIFVHNLWIGPLVTIFSTIIMYQEIGPSVFVGVFFVFWFILFQAWLTKISAKIHKQAAKKTDERLTLMYEVIRAIQVIKMYAWEKPFSKIILQLRKQEIQLIKYASYIKGIHVGSTVFRSRTTIFSSILTYVLLGNILTAAKVFVVTACFNTMKRTMIDLFPYAIELIILAKVSMHRIQRFLLLEESPGFDIAQNKVLQNGELNILAALTPQVILEDVGTVWKNGNDSFQLRDINLEIRKFSFVAVIGSVGSGKSTLLSVILREKESTGHLAIQGKISYASQEPWLFNRSIKKNIILAENYNEDRYKKVLEVCALLEDLRNFPNGDATLAGERGSALSGGQKIRVNLARALYREADIYLLDDPLSALDTHVSNFIFKEMRQFLNRKICILVTHQHQFVSEVDHVVILENGRISNQGSYEKLKNEIKDCSGGFHPSLNESGEKIVEEKKSLGSSNQSGKKGNVTWQVYREYLRNLGSPCLVFAIYAMFVAVQFFASSSDYFLGYWVNLEEVQHLNGTLEETGWNLVQKSCIYVYSILNIMTIILTIASSFLFFNSSMNGASRIHEKMFQSVINTKMTFFNKNQSGNILNRFSKDVQNMDELIPNGFLNCIQTFLSIFGIVFVVSIIKMWLLVPTCLAFFILMFLRRLYVAAGSNLKRLEATTRSPVLTHVSASLQGLTTVRSSNILPRLQIEFDQLQNPHSTARYLVLTAARMFGMWLETTCVILLILLIIGFLISDSDYGGNVGLAITQVMGMLGLVQWAVRQSTDLEASMTSVERVLEYCNLKKEWEGDDDNVDIGNWPQGGRIVFENVHFSYDDNEKNLILRNLNLVIEAGEKIGIVGRTGNGKTSIINALLQFYYPSGKIIIDELDVSYLPPSLLRSSIGVIPQEAVIFSGSVRMNLDPDNKCPDDILWKVLELTQLKSCVNELGSGLESKLNSGGSNLSAGQRQLFCAARAFLKDTKILILDEPTSSLDPDTERAFESALETFSKTRTVLTVAHRLEHVMKADKIMVVGDGDVLEFDEPYLLLTKEKSYLRRLVDNDTNEVMATKLKNIAKKHYLMRHNKNGSIINQDEEININ